MEPNHELASKVSSAVDVLEMASGVLRNSPGWDLAEEGDVVAKLDVVIQTVREAQEALLQGTIHFQWPDYEDRSQQVRVGRYTGGLYQALPGRVTWFLSKDHVSSDVVLEGETDNVVAARREVEESIVAHLHDES
jgi:hypothetical protein